jgi:hypothetical protein
MEVMDEHEQRSRTRRLATNLEEVTLSLPPDFDQLPSDLTWASSVVPSFRVEDSRVV